MKKISVYFFLIVLVLLISGSVFAGGHRPPIFTAINNNDLKKVKEIINKFPSVIEARGHPYDATPLICASADGKTEIVEFLLSKGAKVDAKLEYYQEYKGCTALHLAAMHGRTAVVKLLVKAGAKYDLKDAKGKTPLAYAVKYQRKDVMRILQGMKYRDQEMKKLEDGKQK